MFSGSRSNAKSKKQLKIKLVTFHPQALDEIIEIAQYYETCCVGLGEKFIDQVERAAYVIQKNPYLFAPDKLG